MIFKFKSNSKIEDIVQQARKEGMSEENINLLVEVRLYELEQKIKNNKKNVDY